MKLQTIKLVFILTSSLLNLNLAAQETDSTRYTASNKGKFFISWGGNRSAYTKSDITLTGEGYNIVLSDIEALDRPKGWHVDYINPARMTIPQTNFKLGYYINDKYYVAFALDHMKYVMTQNQYVNVNGSIDLPAEDPGAIYNGNYNNTAVQMTPDFLQFEHTDGLNFLYGEFGRSDDISKLFGINNTDKIQINVMEGIGLGLLYPKTNATVLLKERYDDFHISGFGVSLTAGLNITFLKYFYVQGDVRGGYINMNDIRTTQDTVDRASQDFFYVQSVLSLGGIFRIF